MPSCYTQSPEITSQGWVRLPAVGLLSAVCAPGTVPMSSYLPSNPTKQGRDLPAPVGPDSCRPRGSGCGLRLSEMGPGWGGPHGLSATGSHRTGTEMPDPFPETGAQRGGRHLGKAHRTRNQTAANFSQIQVSSPAPRASAECSRPPQNGLPSPPRVRALKVGPRTPRILLEMQLMGPHLRLRIRKTPSPVSNKPPGHAGLSTTEPTSHLHAPPPPVSRCPGEAASALHTRPSSPPGLHTWGPRAPDTRKPRYGTNRFSKETDSLETFPPQHFGPLLRQGPRPPPCSYWS